MPGVSLDTEVVRIALEGVGVAARLIQLGERAVLAGQMIVLLGVSAVEVAVIWEMIVLVVGDVS